MVATYPPLGWEDRTALTEEEKKKFKVPLIDAVKAGATGPGN